MAEIKQMQPTLVVHSQGKGLHEVTQEINA